MSPSDIVNRNQWREEESYLRFIDKLTDGFELLKTVVDEQGNIVDFVFLKVNHAYESQMSLTAADLIGKRKKEAAPAAEQRWYDYAVKALTTALTLSYEYFNPNLSRFFEMQFIPILPDQIVVLFRDITERKKAEEELRNTELKLQTVVDFTYDWEYWIGTDGKLLYVSPSSQRVTGYKSDEFINDSSLLKRIIHPEDKQEFEAHLESLLKDDSYDKTFRIITRQGEVRWIEHYCQPVFIDRRFSGRRASNRDVTDRILAEGERKKLENQLQDSERLAAIGQTAGMVGHDIRNPLQAMIGDVYLIKENIISDCKCKNKEDLTESLVSIEENIGYINKIVQDLQDYARPITPDYSTANLSKVLVKIFENIKISEAIQLSIGVIGLEKLRTDPMLLQRALSNLVINALQAMPKGGTLEIKGHRQENKAIITVSDTGVGIPDEIKPKLFTPMMTTKAKGQGFGLAVSKRLIEALKGSITFESQPEKGTKFIIELPITA